MNNKSETSTSENECLTGGLRANGSYKKGSIEQPVFTIITAVFNAIDHIEKTILNILEQSYPHIEYIIIDGGSSDGTQKIIKKYEDRIDYWISKNDSGIYDAWNKGLKLATGEIIAFLSAGDFYHVDTIQKVNSFFLKTDECILHGYTQKYSETDGCSILIKNDFNGKNIHKGFGFMHPSVFARSKTYTKVGAFNESFKIAGDTDWMIRALIMDIPFEQNNHIIFMLEGGISQKYHNKAIEEFNKSLITHGFNEQDINKFKSETRIKDIIKKIIKYNKMKSIFQWSNRQTRHCLISFYSFFYNHLPTFTLKRIFLSSTNINIGNKSYIHTPILFFSFKGNIDIGNNTTINSRCYLDNRGHITIGNNVSIAHDTKIYTSGHEIQTPCFSYFSKNVVIEDNVCIFSNVLIMPGVNIAEGAVIFPGSVVTKDVDQYSVVGGNPAKHIMNRNKNQVYKLNHDVWFSS